MTFDPETAEIRSVIVTHPSAAIRPTLRPSMLWQCLIFIYNYSEIALYYVQLIDRPPKSKS